MSDLSTARRYARALSEQAQADGVVNELDEDVELIDSTLSTSRELKLFFENPVVPRQKKFSVLRQLFEKRVSPLTLRFLELTVEKGRETEVPQIAHAYRALRDEERGIIEARVRVPSEMNTAARSEMVARLERLTGKSVRLQVEMDPALLGGAIVRIGDTVYDGSVRNKLQTLRDQMERGQFLQN